MVGCCSFTQQDLRGPRQFGPFTVEHTEPAFTHQYIHSASHPYRRSEREEYTCGEATHVDEEGLSRFIILLFSYLIRTLSKISGAKEDAQATPSGRTTR